MARFEEKLKEFKDERDEKARQHVRQAIAAIMATPDGKEVLWYIVDHTGFMAPKLWEPGVGINHKVAIRDFGSWLMNEMAVANEAALFDMQREFWKRAVKEQLEIENFEKENL